MILDYVAYIALYSLVFSCSSLHWKLQNEGIGPEVARSSQLAARDPIDCAWRHGILQQQGG